jgi:hypothetical protein
LRTEEDSIGVPCGCHPPGQLRHEPAEEQPQRAVRALEELAPLRQAREDAAHAQQQLQPTRTAARECVPCQLRPITFRLSVSLSAQRELAARLRAAALVNR